MLESTALKSDYILRGAVLLALIEPEIDHPGTATVTDEFICLAPPPPPISIK